MQNEHLEHLLQQTDAAMPAPELGRNIVVAAEGRLRRRRRDRAAVGAFSLILAAVAGVFSVHRPQAKPVMVAMQITADDSAIRAQISEETKMAELLITDQRLESARAKLAELSNAPGSEIWLQNQREEAATTLLHGAALSANKDDAAEVCREVVQLFPDAGAAAVAHARLLEIH
jgi:hypothetical protein